MRASHIPTPRRRSVVCIGPSDQHDILIEYIDHVTAPLLVVIRILARMLFGGRGNFPNSTGQPIFFIPLLSLKCFDKRLRS